MNKTIVIGVGGTGLDAIRALRKMIVENHGSLDTKEKENLGFLYIDTDPGSVAVNKDNRVNWEVLGQSIALQPSEYRILQVPDIGSVIEDIDSYPQIKSWLPLNDLDSINKSAKDTPGASQIRALGRFIFTMKAGEVESALVAIDKKLPASLGGGKKPQVHIICSLSGGTGSGMFLDLTYRIREWLNNYDIYGYLVLPELNTLRGERYLVNAYAALMELNYFSNAGRVVNYNGNSKKIEFQLPGKLKGDKNCPFDTCYIVGTRNGAEVEIDLSAVPTMIAHRIYLAFDSLCVSEIEKVINNSKFTRTESLQDKYNGNWHSRNYLTFGLSSIQYPTDLFLEIFSFKLSKALIDTWRKSKNYPGDINSRVQGGLPLLKLTNDFLLGDKDVFGDKHFDGFEIEVDGIINSLKLKYPEKNIAPYLNDQMSQKESAFRGIGIKDYYKNKRNDLNGALREVGKLLRQKISADLVNPELGYDYCEKILEEMTRVFNEKHKVFIDTLNGLPVKEKNSRASLNGFLNEITKIENQTFPIGKDKKIKDCINKISEAMKANLSAKIGLKAYEFGIAFVSHLLEDIETQKENLKNWKNSVEKMRNELEREITGRINSVLKKIESIKEFNGSLLFSEKKIEDVYKQLDIESALRFMENEALKGIEDGVINLPYSNVEVESFYKIGLEWLQDKSVFRLSETNVVEKLRDDYPDESDRLNLLSQNYRKSIPFITIDESQTTKGFDRAYSIYDETLTGRVVGMLHDNEGKSEAIKKEIDEIKRIMSSNCTPVRTSDKHQIIFLQEYSGFPLRIISDLKKLQEKYQEYFKLSDKPLPVHISKTFDPPLMDLFLTTMEQIREVQKTEENFVLARSVGKLKIEENKIQGKPEVRYRYIEVGTGIEKYDVLGTTWDDAFVNFMKDESERKISRDRLDKEVNVLLRDAQTKDGRDKLWYCLENIMKEIRGKYKEEDSVFQKYNEIRSRIVKKLELYDELNPPVEKNDHVLPPEHTNTPNAKPESDDDTKFFKLVRTTLRTSKDGTLSPIMQNMINSSQIRFKINDIRAEEIIKEIRIELFGSPNLKVYEEMFKAFFEDGEIDEDERAILIENQIDLELSDEQVNSIEASIISMRRS